MNLTLVDRSITYPYGVLENVLVRVNVLFILEKFVILYMHEDFKTPLILGRPFLETGRALINLKLGKLFNK